MSEKRYLLTLGEIETAMIDAWISGSIGKSVPHPREEWLERREYDKRTCIMDGEFCGWENYASEELYPVYSVQCSACGTILYDVNALNFCPSCGAEVIG